MAKEKVVLAYSGGLDTSIILTWLKENYDYEVIAVCCNAGQDEDFEQFEKKGCHRSFQILCDRHSDEFISEYIWPTLKAGAVYESDSAAGSSMERPLMQRSLLRSPNRKAPYILHTAVQEKEMSGSF